MLGGWLLYLRQLLGGGSAPVPLAPCPVIPSRVTAMPLGRAYVLAMPGGVASVVAMPEEAVGVEGMPAGVSETCGC